MQAADNKTKPSKDIAVPDWTDMDWFDQSEVNVSVGDFYDISEKLQKITSEAKNGDSHCGTFLAEVSVFLGKKQTLLNAKNDAFRTLYQKLKKLRVATKKDSALRAIVYEIVLRGQVARARACSATATSSQRSDLAFLAKLAYKIYGCSFSSAKLRRLPPFDPSSAAVWFDQVVWPVLKANPDKLKHLAWLEDSNTKFQISKANQTACGMVKSIAKLPLTKYLPFD